MESPQEPLNPLDQALTNVIQDLIGIESITSANFASPNDEMVKDMPKEGRSEELDIKGPTIESWSMSSLETIAKDDLILDTSLDNQPLIAIDAQNPTNTDGEKTKNEESLISSYVTNVISPANMQPIFSIGPFPSSVPPSIVKNVQFSDPLIVGPSNPFFSPVFGSSLSNVRVSSSFNSSVSEEMEAKEKRGARSLDNVVDSDDVSVDSSSSLETVKEFSTAGESGSSCLPNETGKRVASLEAGGSVKQEEKKVVGGKNRTPEEVLSAREDRLKRLEEQAKWLMNKMNATNRRGSALSTRLEELHEVYGEPPVPPPMPDVLPSRRLRTTLSDLPRQVRIFYL